MRTVSGGWNGAIQGKPLYAGCNVLANCVGYANGRFNEIIGENKCKYQLICNAENFIEKAKSYGLQISSKPTLGGIMVWQKGNTLNSKDGAGHVAIVEKIIDSNTIYTSESGYNSFIFANMTRKNSNGNWGLKSPYKFRGCIVNPNVKEEKISYSYKQFVKDIQKAEGQTGKWVDGIAGPKTLELTPTVSATENRTNAVVKPIQKYLYSLGYTEVGKADGIAGEHFTEAVKHFQKDNGCVQDGVITAKAKTWKKLLKLE